MNFKLRMSFATCGLIFAATGALLIRWWDSYSTLSALLGVPFGWALGILLAPYPNEASRFERMSKALVGFFGGVTLTKIYDLLDKVPEEHKNLLMNAIVLRRFGLAVITGVTTLIGVFVARTY